MAHCGQHILEMQLFHELKQRFPNIPDHVVTDCIKQSRGDKIECRCILEAEHWLTCSKHQFPVGGMADCKAPNSPSRPDKVLVDQLSELVLKAVQPRKQVDIDQLIQRQLKRKEKLEKELEKERQVLLQLKASVFAMKQQLKHRPPTTAQMLRLDINRLSIECQKLTNEVDQLSSGSPIPLGETSEEFYQNIYTGQHFKRKSKQNPSRHKGNGKNKDHWVCHMCTFRNHPLLDKCEECEMPRIAQDCNESPNIRIHVTHHNYPCKIIHSWVL